MEPLRGPMARRTVLVTGASAGIGRATALGLARMGAHLAIVRPGPRQHPGRGCRDQRCRRPRVRESTESLTEG